MNIKRIATVAEAKPGHSSRSEEATLHNYSCSSTSRDQAGKRGVPKPPIRGLGGTPSPFTHSKGSHRAHDGVEELKALCRALDVRQRKEVRDYIAYLDKEQNQATLLSSRTGQQLDRDEEMWFDSIEQSLAAALGMPPTPRYRAPATLSSLRDSYQVVGLFVQATGMGAKMSYNRKSLYNLLAELLVTYVKQLAAKIGAPLSLKFVLQNSEKIPALFDRAYPGYVQAGLACIVVDQLLKNPTTE